MAEVLFFLAGIGAIAGAIGVVALRNPFYSVLALVTHLLSLAALFLLLRAEFVAAAQVVVYAGAVMVLYVFVVAYVGGQDEPIGPRAGRGLRAIAGAVRRRAVHRAVRRDARLGPEGDRDRRRAARGRLRLARADRRAAAHALPAAVRDRLVPAADRGRRRGRARAPPRRHHGRRGPGALQRDGDPAPGLHGHDGRGRRRPQRHRRVAVDRGSAARRTSDAQSPAATRTR